MEVVDGDFVDVVCYVVGVPVMVVCIVVDIDVVVALVGRSVALVVAVDRCEHCLRRRKDWFGYICFEE